jgi:multimeric flavodoxin WrbA
MKKVIALMGSPRKGQNTDLILDTLLKGMSENDYIIDKLYLKDLKIYSCTACGYCEKTGECVIKDDMQIVYKYFDESDIFILASPLYFNTVSSLSKIVIDRCQKYFSMKYSLKKKYRKDEDRIGVFLSVGGATFSHDQFDASVKTVDLFFKSIDVKYLGNYFVSGTDDLPVQSREEVLKEVCSIGKNIENIKNFYLHR